MHGRIAPAAQAEDDLPPISYCDPAYEHIDPPSPLKFMAAAFVAIGVVGMLLMALLVSGMP